MIVMLKNEARTHLRIPFKLNYRVLKNTCLESDDGGATDEEFVLDNASRLKGTRHQAEITSSVDQGAIREKLLGRRPEAVWILLLEVPHLMRTLR